MKQFANIFFVITFILGFFAVLPITLLETHSTSSFYENRTLASAPSITIDGLMDGQYFDDLEKSFSDHFALRNQFLKLNTIFNLSLGRPVVNDIVVNSDILLDFYGYLSWDTEYTNTLAEEIGKSYIALNHEIENYGGYFYYLGIPLQSTYFHSHYPNYMDSRLWHMNANSQALSKVFQQNNLSFINMSEIYKSMGNPQELYLKTDHHYSYHGAFIAYTELMNRINEDTGLKLSVLTYDDLIFSTLPNNYLGSSDKKIYGLWEDDDKLEIAFLKSPLDFTRMDNNSLVDSTLYCLPDDDHETISYSIYMGGDIAETVIETNRTELPNVLVFGDSFTNPIETLIWASFNETRYLDLRYYNEQSINNYINQYKPDIVITIRDESVFLSTDGNGAISAF